MKYFVSIFAGPNAGPRCLLMDDSRLLVGRGEDCDIRLSDPSVSRVHVRISVLEGRVYLEDAGSRWGTLVNGAPTDRRELTPGDRIEIGDTGLRLETDSPLATTISPLHRRHPGNALQTPLPKKTTFSPQKGAADDLVTRPKRERWRAASSLDLEKLVGNTFLRYRVESVVARPNSGIIFRATDLGHGDRSVALKIFRTGTFQDSHKARRFLRAMRTTISLDHENLVRLYAAGRTRGLCFMASEFVEGESVSQMIGRIGVAGMLDWRNAWHLADGVARALEYAHDREILHRNLSPSNILIRKADRGVKLGDLMLAKALDQTRNERITQAGEVVGDLRYLSPEQLSGEQPADARADIYSLGATLYAVLTGRSPFEGGTAAEVIRRIVSGVPEPPTKFHLAIPSQFEGLVLRMLSACPENRPENARRLRQELDRIGRFCAG